MTRFMFIYRPNSEAHGSMTPDEMQQHMQKWHKWMAEGFQKGWMLDAGDGLKKEGRIVNGKKVVMDGPFVEAKEIIGGFSIVQAETIDAAAEIAKGCPCLLRGGTVEVRPLEGHTMQIGNDG